MSRSSCPALGKSRERSRNPYLSRRGSPIASKRHQSSNGGLRKCVVEYGNHIEIREVERIMVTGSSVFGFAFGVVALLLIVKIPIDVYRENEQAKWPIVVATITQSNVLRTYHKGYEWHIETEVRYLVDGKEQTSSIHSRVASSGEEREMYQWASQHSPGTSLPIRYDPEHHDTVVPDAGEMPETGSQMLGDWQMFLIFSVLAATLIIIGRVLQRR
jgi:hypothetical protein